MIETIPNPLTDKGVQNDIQRKVVELTTRPVRTSHKPDQDFYGFIMDLIQKAVEWGMSEGFRMGWKMYEVTKGGIRK